MYSFEIVDSVNVAYIVTIDFDKRRPISYAAIHTIVTKMYAYISTVKDTCMCEIDDLPGRSLFHKSIGHYKFKRSIKRIQILLLSEFRCSK